MTIDRQARGATILAAIVLAAGAVLAAVGITSRAKAMSALTRETDALAVTIVAVTHPVRSGTPEVVSLPGNVQAYTDAAIYARTTGYLKRRAADIGSRVKSGQILAEIDTPEIDQQLRQARADLATAQANAKLARTTSERYADLIKSDSVSRQDYDNAIGSYEAKQAAVQSADANVRRLEELQRFKTIYAPFDGVITARNTDIGALINVGSGAKELFHIAAVDRLRISISVPEQYAAAARPGLAVDISLPSLPNRTFDGRVARTARSIDTASRTLLAEIDLDNRSGELLPGSYAEVRLKLPTDAAALRLPVNTLLFRSEGLSVAVVKDHRVHLQPVTAGRDFGGTMEIVSGVSAGDQVVVNPPDSLADGQTVQIATTPAAKGTRE